MSIRNLCESYSMYMCFNTKFCSFFFLNLGEIFKGRLYLHAICLRNNVLKCVDTFQRCEWFSRFV